jgi:hypothetical protein
MLPQDSGGFSMIIQIQSYATNPYLPSRHTGDTRNILKQFSLDMVINTTGITISKPETIASHDNGLVCNYNVPEIIL